MFKFTRFFATRSTPQNAAIPGSSQVASSAGGFPWRLDDFARLERRVLCQLRDRRAHRQAHAARARRVGFDGGGGGG